jgi:hypothetical protein
MADSESTASDSTASADPQSGASATADPARSGPAAPPQRTDRSPWNWLLIIPIVVPLLTPLYNSASPRLLGFPAFYWLQFAFILVGVTTTSVVYQMTKRGR